MLYRIKKAFTLAEILIVVGILGVVAAITIPNLSDNVDEEANVAQLRKTYNELTVAYDAMISRTGTPEGTNVTTTNFANKFAKGLDISKTCGTSSNECFYDSTYNESSDWYKIRLKNGVSIAIIINNSPSTVDFSCNTMSNKYNPCPYGKIMADINGIKGPNTNGSDIFGFLLTKNGVEPMGYSSDGTSIDSTISSKEKLSAWVIKAGNMDYLHCSSLSWPTKTSCK